MPLHEPGRSSELPRGPVGCPESQGNGGLSPIKDYITGEDFAIFSDAVLALLEAVPELRGDPDLGATNEGVTILWLK